MSPPSCLGPDKSLSEVGASWDAVRVPHSIGGPAIGILGTRCGAVIDDPQCALYWFIAPGSVDQWDVPGTRLLSTGAVLAVPPARRTAGPGVHWRVCPGDGDWLTQAEALRAALEDSINLRSRTGMP
ncbi:hypothetical protein SRIMHP_26330 [Streptomyces rimosus subsp. rimosus]|uniref:Uncharacterized protein n=1 Tax=Streptomyces rimosus subsp. rimosus TaxID=132474 RepID=A0ABY3Z7B5_STRRM|nr:hypothetical protein CTZ40_28910 [Streptomyces rimosus]QTL89285.1 hypothetical protein FMM49_29420 [Streptomyces rimosus subsp. rimosus]QEV78447.1 hypothetical protein CP984_28870 [Streptomyces rimosus]UNZ06183.1 hypothetical protein SRIMR7_28955 [Streptomyces rimosus subsp. rimosus]UTH97639.1 hypothetical protein SRIMHP_26330 [Streptomyces rimosus subsp. rimosus]